MNMCGEAVLRILARQRRVRHADALSADPSAARSPEMREPLLTEGALGQAEGREPRSDVLDESLRVGTQAPAFASPSPLKEEPSDASRKLNLGLADFQVRVDGPGACSVPHFTQNSLQPRQATVRAAETGRGGGDEKKTVQALGEILSDFSGVHSRALGPPPRCLHFRHGTHTVARRTPRGKRLGNAGCGGRRAVHR